MSIRNIGYKVLNYITLGLPEIERKKKLRVKAKERLTQRFGENYEQHDCRTLRQNQEVIEDEDGVPLRINLYESNTRKQEKDEIEKQRIRSWNGEVRPQTESQDFVNRYFPASVPIGIKRPVYGWVCFEGQRPPVIGYDRDKFYHSSLRDVVGVYHSLLLLERDSGNIDEKKFNSEVRDLERYLESLDEKSDFITNSVHDNSRKIQKYDNISTLQQLTQEIESTKRRREI